MELHAIEDAPRLPQRPVQLVLVRANGPLFYSLAAGAILEATVPAAGERLLHFFGGDRPFSEWLTTEWLPRKHARARQLRAYVQATWPEYDWVAGADQFHATVQAEVGRCPNRQTAAHEALARCVAAAQGGVFYRSLSRWAEDGRVRELARGFAAEEAESFARFRSVFDRRARVQGFGCMAAWTAVLKYIRAGRDHQLARAFYAINAHCAPHVPFPVLEYEEFLTRMAAVIERHGSLGRTERMLFRTWKRQPRIRLPEAASARAPMARAVLGRAA
jgi:hypothetical protein